MTERILSLEDNASTISTGQTDLFELNKVRDPVEMLYLLLNIHRRWGIQLDAHETPEAAAVRSIEIIGTRIALLRLEGRKLLSSYLSVECIAAESGLEAIPMPTEEKVSRGLFSWIEGFNARLRQTAALAMQFIPGKINFAEFPDSWEDREPHKPEEFQRLKQIVLDNLQTLHSLALQVELEVEEERVRSEKEGG